MKKFLLCLLAITISAGSLTACQYLPFFGDSATESSVAGSSKEEKEYCLVTFKQEGQADIVKTVEAGKALTDIPTPVQKIGYTTKWSVEEFASITENMTITAVATANEYTITYDAGEGTIDTPTQTVVYDSVPGSFVTPTLEGYNFVCWTYEGKAILATDVWKIANDVTFVASWIPKEKCTITFVQTGYEPIIVEVLEGATVTGDMIPQTQPKEGYTVVWEEKIPSTITENIVINAVATPNAYTITYDAGEGTVLEATHQVIYDSVPQAFAVPTCIGYRFKGWEYEGQILSANDVWTIAKDVTVTATWEKVCVITLNYNGGTGSTTTTITVVIGEAYSLPTLTKNGYDFYGWKYGKTKIKSSGVWTIDEVEVTLDAQWVEDGWTNNY